jgi:uncharacterized protein YbaR (Trm112 family)
MLARILSLSFNRSRGNGRVRLATPAATLFPYRLACYNNVMPIRDEFLSMLRCPVTRRPLTRADADLIARLNAQIGKKALKNRAGDAIETPLEEGLLEPTDGWLYPIRDDIPSLLPDEAIATRGVIS